MGKNALKHESSENSQPSVAISADGEITLVPFWILDAGTAKKLGQRSAGILNYHVLADNDRLGILIAVTRNEGGGYFSRERVPFRTIVTCLEKYKSGAPFVSKILKDVFVSKSANNAGFMSAVLHALGLLAPAPEAKTQHVVSGDWSLWEQTVLAKTGTRIELPAENSGEIAVGSVAVSHHKEIRKTVEIPARNSQ